MNPRRLPTLLATLAASRRALMTTAGQDAYHGQADGRSIVLRPTFLRHAYVVPSDGGFGLSASDVGRIDVYGPEGAQRRSGRVPDEALSGEVTDPEAVREGSVDGVTSDGRRRRRGR